MKALAQLLFPTLKAFIGVLMFMFTVVSVSYVGIVSIAKTEAKNIEEKIIAVRESDMSHLDKRFDRLEQLIKEKR